MKLRKTSILFTKRPVLFAAILMSCIVAAIVALPFVDTRAQPADTFLAEPENDPNQLQVIQTVPVGDLPSTAANEIVVSFNQPVIALGKVGTSNIEPFRVEPALAGRFRWYGSSVASYVLDKPLQPGVQYKVTVPTALKDIEGRSLKKEHVFQFKTKSLEVTYTYPYTNATIEYSQPVNLTFSLPVSPESIEPFVEFRTPTGTVSAIVTGPSDDDYISYDARPEQYVTARPSKPLPRGAKVTFVVKKGAPILGQSHGGLQQEFQREFSTIGPVAATFHAPERFFQNSYSTGVSFNNEISSQVMYRYVQLYNDANKLLQPSSTDDDGTRTHVSIMSWNVEPGKSYTMVVLKGLPDIHGNVLPAEKKFVFKMPAVRPSLSMDGGWQVSEAMMSPKIPYRYGNIANIDVEIATPSIEDMIAYGNDIERNRLKKLKFKKIPLPVNAGPNQILNRQFDFSGFVKINQITTSNNEKKSKKTGPILYKFTAMTTDYSGQKQTQSHIGLLQSTDLGVTVRESRYAAHVWVHSMSSGAPVKGVLLTEYNSMTAGNRCNTDDQGYCRIAKTNKTLQYNTSFVAQDQSPASGNDFAVVTANQDRVYNGVSWPSHRAGMAELRGMVLYDRLLYRPGDTVSFKGLLSLVEDGKILPFSSGDVVVTINDSRGTSVYSKVLKPTKQGGVFDTITLASGIPLGHYSVSIKPNTFRGHKADDSMGGVWSNFQVEEFRPLTFSVSVNGTSDRVMDSPAPIQIEGRYLFGAPLSDARVSVTLFQQPGSVPLKNFPSFETGGSVTDDYYESSVERIHQRGQGRLDSSGRFVLNVPAGAFEPQSYQYMTAQDYQNAKKGKVVSLVTTAQKSLSLQPHRNMRVEASVFDASNRSITKNASFHYFASAVYPAVRPVSYVFEENKDASVEVVFVDTKGLAAPGSGDVYIFRTEYNVIETKGPSGSLQRLNSTIRILEKKDSIQSSGKKVYTFKPTKAGSYQILIRSSTGAYAITNLFVSGKGYGWWWGNGDDSVNLIADKDQYQPGDTAKILIQSPYESARAIVTVEREDVFEKKVVQLTSSAQTVSIPLKPEYIPGVQVSVMIFKPRVVMAATAGNDDEADPGKPAVRMGTVRLDVSSASKRLPLSITKSCDPCGPGQEVTIEIKTAAGAEVAVDVADRAILDLVGYRFADPIPVFYGQLASGIRVLDNRGAIVDQFLRSGKGDAGGDGDAASLGGFGVDGEDGIRKDFRHTAYWNPVLVADARGIVTVTFKLPDNLTTFRIMAMAAKDSLYGNGEDEFQVQKSIVTMPVLPNFVRPGDQIWAGGLLINHTGERSTFDFEFQSDPPLCSEETPVLGFLFPASIKEKLTKRVTLDAGESREVLFSCSIPRQPSFLKDRRGDTVNPLNPSFRLDAGSIGFRLRASLAGGKANAADGMSRSVPLRQEVVREAFTISGATDLNAASAKESLIVPDPKKNPGELSVQLSGTAMLSLKSGYDFFSANPYLCLEQRASAYLVHAMAGDFAPQKTGGSYDPSKLQELFFGSLADHQYLDGGLRPWLEWQSASDPYLTAYILESLYLVDVPAKYKTNVSKVTDRALTYLVAYRDNPKRDTQFYLVESLNYINYVLSLYGRGRADLVKSALADYTKLSLRARGYALLAALQLQIDTGANGEKIIQDFTNRLTYSTRRIDLRESLPFSASRIYYSSNSTAGVWIRYLVKQNKHADVVAKMIQAAIQRNSILSSSHDEAALAVAVRSYHDVYEKAIPSDQVSVMIDSKKFFSKKFDAKIPLLSVSADTDSLIKNLSLKDIGSAKSLVFENPSKQGRLYYNATLDYALDFQELKAKDEGIYVERQLLDQKMQPVSLNKLRRGDVYPVKLRVITRKPIANFLLRDPIASATEIVNTSFETEGLSLRQLEKSQSSSYSWLYADELVEKRYDGYIVTSTYLPAGIHEYVYLMRPIQAGVTGLPPTQAQAMYESEIFGRTDGAIVETLK